MKQNEKVQLLEGLYNFCGTFEKQLKKDYRKAKIKEQGANFTQFCIIMYEGFLEEAKALNIKKR